MAWYLFIVLLWSGGAGALPARADTAFIEQSVKVQASTGGNTSDISGAASIGRTRSSVDITTTINGVVVEDIHEEVTSTEHQGTAQVNGQSKVLYGTGTSESVYELSASSDAQAFSGRKEEIVVPLRPRDLPELKGDEATQEVSVAPEASAASMQIASLGLSNHEPSRSFYQLLASFISYVFSFF